MTNKDLINDFVSDNWSFYKDWLNEYIGYAGGVADWDTDETRAEFYRENATVIYKKETL